MAMGSVLYYIPDSLKGVIRVPGYWIPDFLKGIIRLPPGLVVTEMGPYLFKSLGDVWVFLKS